MRIFTRVGLVWLAFMLFVLDGGKLLRAYEKAPTKEQDKTDSLEQVDAAMGKSDDADSPNIYSPPEWFDGKAEFDLQSRMVFVETDDPADSVEHAQRQLEEKSVQAIKNATSAWLGLASIRDLDLDPAYVFENLLYESHQEIRQDLECKIMAEQLLSERGLAADAEKIQFYRGYAQFQLTDEFQDYIEVRLREGQTKKRLIRSGLVGGSIFALLAIVFGYLKMETATRGFYSRRLQTASLLIAAIVVATFYWFGQQLV